MQLIFSIRFPGNYYFRIGEKMNMKRKEIWAITILLLMPTIVLLAIQHQDEDWDVLIEERIYSDASLEDDFSESSVVIVLNKEASMAFKTYTPEDFGEGLFSRVDDSTRLTMELIKKQLEAERTGDWSGLRLHIENGMLVDVDKFRRVLELTLTPERSKERVLMAIEFLMATRDDILYAGPDYFSSPQTLPFPKPPNYLTDQYVVHNKISLANTNSYNDAWGIETGSTSVVVGVLDTGIAANHPSLSGNIYTGAGHLNRDFTTGTTHGNVSPHGLQDPGGHGTEVAGIIGANADNTGTNGTGAVGVSQDVRLVSLRVFNGNDGNAHSRVRYAVDYATSVAIPILNYSGGGTNNDAAQKTAITNYPGLFVTAAGNGGKNTDINPFYPSSYNLPNIISVGASTLADQRASNSNFGSTSVDLFAPGSIFSTTMTQFASPSGYTQVLYKFLSDATSYSTPFVTGVAALIRAMHLPTGISTSAIKAAILNNVDMVSGLTSVSGGRLNAFNALQSTQGCTYTVTFPTNINVAAGGATAIVTVTPSKATCPFPPITNSNSSWISTIPQKNGNVNIYVNLNYGASRSGTVIVAGKTISVTQASGTACTAQMNYCCANTQVTCSNECNQTAINMGCNSSIPWCWEWFNNCISECEAYCDQEFSSCLGYGYY